MTTRILFENLKIYAHHGVLEEERIIGTYYLINAEIHADLWKASLSDDLKDTINYAEINEIFHEEMRIPSNLLEHVVARMMNAIEKKFRKISYIKIKLTKTSPPMRGEMDGVSVEMEKDFLNFQYK